MPWCSPTPPRPGGAPFLSAVLATARSPAGRLWPRAALSCDASVVEGDAVAGEPAARCAPAGPPGRAHQALVAKLVAVMAFVLVTVLVVAAVVSRGGHDVRPGGRRWHLGIGTPYARQIAADPDRGGYVVVSMLGVAAFALLFSTLTDSRWRDHGCARRVGDVLAAVKPRAASPSTLTAPDWLASSPLPRPGSAGGKSPGLALKGVYVGVLPPRLANFTTKASPADLASAPSARVGGHELHRRLRELERARSPAREGCEGGRREPPARSGSPTARSGSPPVEPGGSAASRSGPGGYRPRSRSVPRGFRPRR